MDRVLRHRGSLGGLGGVEGAGGPPGAAARESLPVVTAAMGRNRLRQLLAIDCDVDNDTGCHVDSGVDRGGP